MAGDLKRQAIQEVLREVLHHFKDAESQGVNLLCPDGQRRLCHPILCQYIADYQEQFLLSCITYGCCPRCTIPRYHAKTEIVEESAGVSISKGKCKKQQADDGPRTKRVMHPDSGDMFREYSLRNEIEHQELRAKYGKDEDSLKKYGLKTDPPFTDIFKFSDIHSMIAPDLLHQVSKMLYDNLYSWIMDYLVKSHNVSKALIEKEIDVRFSHLPPYPGLKTFPKGISCTERWTGNEYKAMARVLLPVIQDLLSTKMVRLIRAYLDIIQLAHYTSHTEQTVEYLRRAVNEYTKH